MKHIDLFSGIGGFSLAASWAGFETILFCDNNKFCQELLKRRFNGEVITDTAKFRPHNEKDKQELEGTKGNKLDTKQPRSIPIYGDIRDLDGTKFRGATLLTGGFPCQPFSQAGKRKGKEDDRYLWDEMFRVIREAQPKWVLAENVYGLLTIDNGLVFNKVLSDLESIGYEVQPLIIPACAVNAPHRRDRVWIVAKNTVNNGNGNREPEKQEHIRDKWDIGTGIEVGVCDEQISTNTRQQCGEHGRSEGVETDQTKRTARTINNQRCGEDVADTESGRAWNSEQGGNGTGQPKAEIRNNDRITPDSPCGQSRKQTEPEGREDIRGGDKETFTDSEHNGLEGWQFNKRAGLLGQQNRNRSNEGTGWDKNWIEAATEFCLLDDGLPAELDGFKLSKSKHREERLKALGNAIVPQVAYKIIKVIADYEVKNVE